MAFNKFMHPRNRYKDNKPNFDELARKYPEFGRHVIRNQSGNATLDFRNAEALRSLTCTLLREDFGLDVDLPLDRLIPTLSLRLNYIHWIEDLLASTKHHVQDGDAVYGIDVGCGPSCIYPLLGAQMNGWHFLASEVDALAIHYARQNVSRNGLAHKITVIETDEGSMFRHVLDSASSGDQQRQRYDFTMCNPPFFGSALDAQGIMGSRSMARPEPKTVSTAAELEMIAEGGETEFVRRMIEESLTLRKQVVWYTSLLGKKSSLALLKEELKRHKIRNVTHTEFCQGRTMRWGIAWTFYEDVEPLLPASKRRKLMEPCPSFVVPVPDSYIRRVLESGQSGGLQNKIQAVATAMQNMMEDLQMTVERKPTSKWCAKFVLTARRDTWSHQRRKRRREKLHPLAAPSSGTTPVKSASATPQRTLSPRTAEGTTATERASPGTHTRAPTTTPASLSDLGELKVPSTSSTASGSAAVPKRGSGGTDEAIAQHASTGVGTSPEEMEVSEPKCDHVDPSWQCQTGPTSRESMSSRPQSKDAGFVNRGQTASTCPASTNLPPGQRASSSDEMDDRFPLDIRLDVKLGEKRAIVVEAAAVNASERAILHQVVQYIKNQMK